MIKPHLVAACSGNYYTLSLNRNILDFDSLKWSTGEQTESINIYESGNYSLTAKSNSCGSFTESVYLAMDKIRPVNFSFRVDDKPYDILLFWDTVEGAENYQILYGLDGDSSIKSNTNDVSKRIFNLRCCSDYSFYVKAFCENSTSTKIGPLLYSTPKCAGIDCNSNNDLIFEFFTDYENQITNISIVHPKLSNVVIKIADLQGRIIKAFDTKSYQKIDLDISQFSSGLYLLFAETEGYKQSEKLLIR